MNILVIIPARGGSKGLPGKNIKILNGKPMICYTIDVARSIVADENICVSTDDSHIIDVVNNYGLDVPFVRPTELASDTSTTNDVLLHALSFYEDKGLIYDVIVLLQPTSPLRKQIELQEALSLYNSDIDMVVSVTKSHTPAVLCKENDEGYVELVINKSASRRQELEEFYEYNGAIYIINTESLKQKGLANFTKKVKYVMPKSSSIDIDDILDFVSVEAIMVNKIN